MDIRPILRHRHFVALPLVILAALCVLVFQDSRRGKASLTETPRTVTISAGSGVSLGEGIRAVAGEEGATVTLQADHPVLVKGSMLLASDGAVRWDIGGWTMMTAAGTSFVERNPSGAVSLAAITAPVLIKDQKGGEFVLPVTLQWRSSGAVLPPLTEQPEQWRSATAMQTIPLSFLQEQRKAALAIAADSLPQVSAVPPDLSAKPWMFSQAGDRQRPGQEEALFGYIRYLLEKEELPTLQSYLAHEEVAVMLRASSSKARVLPAIALLASDSHRASLLLLPFLADDPDMWLLLSLHPQFHDAVPLITAPSLEGDRQLVQLLSLPRSDILAEAFAEGTVARWRETVQNRLAAAEKPEPLLQLFLEDGLTVLEDLQNHSYLHRVVQYAGAYQVLAKPYTDGASETVTSLMRRIHALEEEVQFSGEASVSSEPSEKPEAPVTSRQTSAAPHIPALSSDQVRSITYAALRNAGALFTVQTQIRPQGDGDASVENILFGNVLFSFTFVPQTSLVSRIVREGKRMPFSMPFDRFVAWAKGK